MFKKSAVDLNSAFYPQPAFYSQTSAVCILHSVCISPLVRSLQSAVRSLRFILTDSDIVCHSSKVIDANQFLFLWGVEAGGRGLIIRGWAFISFTYLQGWRFPRRAPTLFRWRDLLAQINIAHERNPVCYTPFERKLCNYVRVIGLKRGVM